MNPQLFGILGEKLIGILLMIALIYSVKANPRLQEKKIWKFNLTTFAYAMIVYFIFMAFITMQQRGFLF